MLSSSGPNCRPGDVASIVAMFEQAAATGAPPNLSAADVRHLTNDRRAMLVSTARAASLYMPEGAEAKRAQLRADIVDGLSDIAADDVTLTRFVTDLWVEAVWFVPNDTERALLAGLVRDAAELRARRSHGGAP